MAVLTELPLNHGERRDKDSCRTCKASIIFDTRSLGALRAPTSSWGPFGPLDFVLRALRALRPCDKHRTPRHKKYGSALPRFP